MSVTQRIVRFFDKLEDRVRIALSHHPIVYAFIGGVAIVLFWRGVWMIADTFAWLDGAASVLMSTLVLLVMCLLVSLVLSDHIILSGLRHEKKLDEKTEKEVRAEMTELQQVLERLDRIERELRLLKKAAQKKG